MNIMSDITCSKIFDNINYCRFSICCVCLVHIFQFCHTYSSIDAWELESLGFQRCKTVTKLRVLKVVNSYYLFSGDFCAFILDCSYFELLTLPA